MALAALIDGRPSIPKTSGQRGICIGPDCQSEMVAKVGTVIRPHWAHMANEACGLDDNGEKGWHLTWRTLFVIQGAQTEVDHGRHRADIVLIDGRVFEFQTTFLDPGKIASRETVHGDMAWIYRMVDELVEGRLIAGPVDLEGRAQFKWLAPRRSFLSHRRPVYWQMQDEVWHVETITPSPDQTTSGGAVWTVTARYVSPDWCDYSERFAAGEQFGNPPTFYGLNAEVARATAAGAGLTLTPATSLPDDLNMTCERETGGFRRPLGIDEDPAYMAAMDRYRRDFPACSVCGRPMIMGQKGTHNTCAPATKCTCVNESRQAWREANVYPIIGNQRATPCSMHPVNA